MPVTLFALLAAAATGAGAHRVRNEPHDGGGWGQVLCYCASVPCSRSAMPKSWELEAVAGGNLTQHGCCALPSLPHFSLCPPALCPASSPPSCRRRPQEAEEAGARCAAAAARHRAGRAAEGPWCRGACQQGRRWRSRRQWQLGACQPGGRCSSGGGSSSGRTAAASGRGRRHFWRCGY